QTSGTYTETEWIKSDAPEADSAPADAKSAHAVRMNTNKWQKSVARLAAQFGGIPQRKAAALGVQRYSAALGGVDISVDLKDASQPHGDIPVGKLSPIQENDSHYYTMAVIEKGKDRLKLASVAWRKEPLRSWLTKAEVQAPASVAAVSANYALPVIVSPSGACADDTWTPTGLTDVPDAREFPTAVWTGSEMIVWGGYPQLNTGGRYDPTTDSWTATSTA